MILESERRWSDWSEGQWIELPDGQRWSFFEPSPTIRDGVPGWSFAADTPELDAILSARFGLIIVKWGKASDDAERASVILEAAWFLLARNYQITQDEFEAILLRASAWSDDEQQQLGSQLQGLVGIACARSTAMAEVS